MRQDLFFSPTAQDAAGNSDDDRKQTSAAPGKQSAVAPRPAATFNTVLIVEAPQAWPFIDALPNRASVVMAHFSALNCDLMLRVAPDVVAAPLFGSEFDAFDVLVRLNSLRYRGHVGVIAPRLPNRTMVETELRNLAPAMQVCLLESER